MINPGESGPAASRIPCNSQVAILVSSMLIGAVIMALEMVWSRYLIPYFGDTIFTWASLISTVLIALMTGYFGGGYFSDNHLNQRGMLLILFFSSAYILCIPLYSDTLMVCISRTIIDVRYGSLLTSFIVIFIPVTILGMFTPYATKVSIANISSSGRGSGLIYGFSTLGSVAGTLLVAFFLIPSIGSRKITFIISLVNLSVVIILIMDNLIQSHFKDKDLPGLGVIYYLPLPFIYIALMYMSISGVTFASSDLFAPTKDYAYTAQNESLLSSQYVGLLESVESQYNNIKVYKSGSYVTMKFSRANSEFSESTINTSNSMELPLSYNRTIMAALAYSSDCKKILMVGLGGGAITRYINTFMPNVDITNVELDRDVIRLAKQYFGVQESNNFRIIESDGRIYLKQNMDTKYDIVILDAFRGGYIPFHLLTKEYFSLIKEHLNTNGCVVLNLHTNSELYDSTIVTLKDTFANIDSYIDGITIVYDGQKRSRDSLAANAKTIQDKYGFYYDMNKIIHLTSDLTYNPDAKLLTDDFAPVNFLDAITRHNMKQQ
ncbi:MAG: fused MFS/spermidine synthase [Syntrophobacteraceae bacterium]